MPPLLDRIDHWYREHRPFLFLCDFEQRELFARPLDTLSPDLVRFDFHGHGNDTSRARFVDPVYLRPAPITFPRYRQAFDYVVERERSGFSYLVNLTFASEVSPRVSLREIYHHVRAPYRLLWGDRFVVFSPESFVRVHDQTITTFPMKGTGDASRPHAARRLLDNEKEAAEHATVVDLLRNDLSIVADDVHVPRYRYLDRVATPNGGLLQVSSEIRGRVKPEFRRRGGRLLWALLPAGSVSGAPKRETCRIIRTAEDGPRGFYCGVAAYYDGHTLDSCVLIRYIERHRRRFFFRSGGGITIHSTPEEEYDELVRKIDLPLG